VAAEGAQAPQPGQALPPEPTVVGPRSAPDDVLRVEHIAKRFGPVTALRDVNLHLKKGEVLGLLGDNGAGKSTLVKILVGLVRPTDGTAEVAGARAGSHAARAALGYLAELFRFPGWYTAAEVLELHQRLAGSTGGAAERTRLLELVALTDATNRRVDGMSKGMQQRLGIAQALVGNPRLLLLDEPTSALDPVGRHDVREIIRGLASRGTAVFLNSHLLSEVEQVCDRVAVVDHGRVIASGTMNELLSGTVVRVRVTGLTPGDKNKLADFGRVDDEGDQLTFANLDQERVPQLVAAIVDLGGRVYEVAPRHQTLEDRFLQLLADEDR
jgi:ABC-2 type transport system ATP-binding protein